MRLAITLTAIFIFVQSCRDCDRPSGSDSPISVNKPKPLNDGKIKKDIMVRIDNQDQLYIGDTKMTDAEFDSLLIKKILRYKDEKLDTPTVVINADTAATYGRVFRIVRAVNQTKYAKVTAQVKE